MSNDIGDESKDFNEASNTQITLIPASSNREQLIKTAIKFLSHPKVLQNSYESKRVYLLQKGLNEDEIDKAFSRYSEMNAPQKSIDSSTWTETGYSFVVFGVACLGIYKLLNHFINHVILGKKDETVACLENNMREINESISTMQTSLSSVTQKLLEINTERAEEEQMQTVTLNDLRTKINDLSLEVNSIKSILLSRHQFPATPSINPTIPTWQLKENPEEEETAQDGETLVKEIETHPKELTESLNTKIVPSDVSEETDRSWEE